MRERVREREWESTVGFGAGSRVEGCWAGFSTVGTILLDFYPP